MTDLSAIRSFADTTRPALRDELKKIIAQAGDHGTPDLQKMITYQLGWTGENAGPKAEGKQLRGQFCLLSCQAAGGDWQDALPAAAAVELIHNFSLVHDDIEDNGQLRRGRPTVWKVWGEAQAINTGDAMFVLANDALLNLAERVSPEAALEAGKLLQTTCLRLTQGQHLDIAFENLDEVSLESYWQMIEGKTAALLAFSLSTGALCAEAAPSIQAHYRDFGHYLGLAFQVQDDILGIWGEEDQTGKSTTGDLITRKKTLPVLFGLNQKEKFYKEWNSGVITPEKALQLANILETEGGRDFAESSADQLTAKALEALQKTEAQGEAGEILRDTARQLLSRRK
jgi:geranylgeranyl diphosphate synthase type I